MIVKYNLNYASAYLLDDNSIKRFILAIVYVSSPFSSCSRGFMKDKFSLVYVLILSNETRFNFLAVGKHLHVSVDNR